MSEVAEDDGFERALDLGGGPSIGRPFLERLLLSIIDAHPGEESPGPATSQNIREKRLKEALRSLFNESPATKWRHHAALLWIAQQLLLDRQKQSAKSMKAAGLAPQVNLSRMKGEEKPRSDRELTRQAAKQFYSNEKMADRLRNAWRTETSLVSGKTQGDFWIEMARSHDDVCETVEMRELLNIWKALRQAKIPAVPNWPDGKAMTNAQAMKVLSPLEK